MPQAILAAAGSAASAVSGAVYSGLTTLGVSAGAASLASTYAASITAVSVATLAYVGPSLLFAPNIPAPDVARSVKRQPIPDRVSGYGKARVGGALMLYEAEGNKAFCVYAMHDGLIAGWDELYLNDLVATINPDRYVAAGPDLRYGKNSDNVLIDARLGLPTETNFNDVTSQVPTLWPADARGDGIASLQMIARAPSLEFFIRDYPNGLPQPSRVGRLQYCWDPRLGDRGTITDDSDKAASPTWVGGSQNPILQLLDFMTNESTGLGFPLSRFLPNIAAWEAAAHVCDGAVPLAAGGTVHRYQAGGVYLHSTAPADVIATILATCDGWMAQDATGCFTVQAGEYVEPTVTITEAHIVSLSRQFFREDEKATNEIVISYTDPSFDYTEVETTPWRIEADIAARGDQVRSQRLSLPWTQNNSQARRLAKIAARKATAPISGTLTTTLDGLRAWSERRIRIQAPSDGEAMADIVVDILPLTLNPDMTVSIPFVSCDPTAYDWTTDEETEGAGDDVRPDPEAVATPIIDSIVPFSQSGGTARLRIFLTNGVGDATYVAQWRVTGSGSGWTTDAEQVGVADSPPYFETGVVDGATLDVQVAQIGAGGVQSDWSATEVVDASVATLLVSMDFLGAAYINGVFTANSLGALSGWAYSRAGTAYSLDGSTSFAANTPRLTSAGLLIEGAATNRLLYSHDIDNAAWTKSVAVVTANYGAAPDGTTTADRVEFIAGTCYIQKSGVAGLTASSPCTLSFFARSLSGTPTIGLRSGVSGLNTTRALTGSWARYTWTFNAGAATEVIQFVDSGIVPGASATADFLLWGVQVETGSSASSYIPTTSAAASRAADVATLTISAGDGTDELTVDYVGGSVTLARSTFASPTVIDFGDLSQPWAGKNITAAEMVTV